MKFAARTDWHRQHNRLAGAIEERRKSGKPFFDLTVTNPTLCGFKYSGREILAALSGQSSLQYAPEPFGAKAARESVAELYRRRGAAISPSHVVLTSGSSEAYSRLFSLLCNPGDNVIIPVPSYPLFEYLAQLHDVKTATYNLTYENGWLIDTESIRTSITPATKAIILINPHNPSGMFLKNEEYERIVAIAEEFNIALIVDEVFSEYGAGDDSARVATTAGTSRALTFTLDGLSKMCALPQIKLGWIVASGPPDALSEALGRLEILNDMFLNVNTPAQAGLRELLQTGAVVRNQIIERTRSNRKYLKSRIKGDSVISVLESEGGWSLILRIPGTKPEEMWAVELIEKAGVVVHPGYFYDFATEGYLILSLIIPPEIFRPSVDALLQFVEKQTVLAAHA